jgi:hypothetical protein
VPGLTFLQERGFSADPFESTNAENEEWLAAYFIPPPYFETVLGDPTNPKSQTVFAPRGSGKTAQRRIIETASPDLNFLCVTYDTFDQPSGFRVEDSTLAYHLNQLCRLILVGLLMALDRNPDELALRLTIQQKTVLKAGVARFLGSLSAQDFHEAVQAVKSFGDKAGDFWHKYGGPIAAAIQILLKKAGLDGVEVPKELAEAKLDDTLNFYFSQLLTIAKAIGFRSTYVLVDRVDEAAIVRSDPGKAFSLIQPLVVDLPTLETDGVGFKFFLWDRLKNLYLDGGGRPDRVQLLTLNWSVHELRMMLQRRIRAYSRNAVSSLNALTCSQDLDLDRLVAYLAAGSPRDVIRASKSIVDEHSRMRASFGTEDTDAHIGEPDCIDEQSLWLGIERFVQQRAEEVVGQYLPDLRRIGQPTFVITELASRIFHISQQAARSKVQNWMATGVVSQIGERPNPPNKPSHLYGMVDMRVAAVVLAGVTGVSNIRRHARPQAIGGDSGWGAEALGLRAYSDVPRVLARYMIECPTCRTINITEDHEITCANCSHKFLIGDARSLLDICAL